MPIRSPLLVNGMFRSGTTLLWRILLTDPGFTDFFCEPLHPRLPRQIIKYQHYRNYTEYPDLLKNWNPEFARKKLFLRANENYENLGSYLKKLFGNNYLIKSVRLMTRTDWMLHNFTKLKVVNIVRDPRAVCFSYFKKCYQPSLFDKAIRLLSPFKSDNCLPINTQNVNLNIYQCQEYLSQLVDFTQRMNKDIFINELQPFEKILLLWKANIKEMLDGFESNDQNPHILKYEDLCSEPAKTIRKLYEDLNRELPTRTLQEAEGKKIYDLNGHKKWQSEISDEWIHEWKRRTKPEKMNNSLNKLNMLDLLDQFNYQLC